MVCLSFFATKGRGRGRELKRVRLVDLGRDGEGGEREGGEREWEREMEEVAAFDIRSLEQLS